MMKFKVVLVCTAILLGNQLAKSATQEHGLAEHVVILVWDGMRPDFVRPQLIPNLYLLGVEGVFFKNHHPVYVSSTEVNGRNSRQPSGRFCSVLSLLPGSTARLRPVF